MMKKAEALDHWQKMEPNQNPLPLMRPIPYKSSGSTYGSCGIRIDGTPEFVDAVLSNLKSLIDGENQVTRLALARNVVDGSGIGKDLPNSVQNAECCYIRLHMRSVDGAATSAFFDRHLKGATERFASAMGIVE